MIPGCPKSKWDWIHVRLASPGASRILFDTMTKTNEKQMEQCTGMLFPAMRWRFRNQLEKEFTDEDWLHCLHLGNFKDKVWNLEGWKWRIVTHSCDPGSLTQEEWSYHQDWWITRQQKLDWWREERNAKKTDNLLSSSGSFQQRCERSGLKFRSHETKKSMKVIGDLNKMQCFWACLEVWQTRSNAIITYQSVPKRKRRKAVSESGKRAGCLQDSSHLEKSRTPIQNHHRVANGLTRTSNSLSIQSRQHPQRRNLQGPAVHAKNCRTSSETDGYERHI